ncbi:MAG TPA: hemolysin family protein [Longimicrobiaceae bacterium]|nr:hemolysin family protein [Longimicrobiaceae bacterium]
MSGIWIQVLLIVVLVLVNGVFAMSEIAVVSARKTRLQQRAEAGDTAARRALALASEPNRFLSTVQIGMSLVGVLAGAFGGVTVAGKLAVVLRRTPLFAPYAETLALVLVVIAITYLTLVIGELVPKRIGLNAPERVAALVAGPMHALSIVAAPAVRLLSFSTDLVLRLLGVRSREESPVTGAEIAVMMEASTQAGVFEPAEQEMVERVFRLGDQRVDAIMTPRRRVVWVDINDPPGACCLEVARHGFARYPVCDGELDRVLGMVALKDVFAATAQGQPVDDLRPLLRQPLYIPESTRALRVLEAFRDSGIHLALVVDEYGGTAGLVTLADVLEEIAGDLSAAAPGHSPAVVRRDDGSLLVDASVSMDDFREHLELEERRDDPREYRTLGGFVFTRLGRVPTEGEHVDASGYRIEVVDMDGNRIDKLLVSPLPDVDAE